MKKETKSSAAALNIRPLGDRVLVRPEDHADAKSPSGIIIPDTARKEKPERGIVVAVGEGKRTDRGEVLPMHIKVGDTIIFDRYGFTEVKIDDTDYFIVSESNILAIVK
ncbi:co-chaperone GroES [Candidatus Kaiserbacteria bacterium]|nr:co-chaperone GroES [Candidatus Kaiserbacteria bacterium]